MQVEEQLAVMQQHLELTAERFSDDPVQHSRSLRELMASDPEMFHAAALAVLHSGRGSLGHHFIASLVAERQLLSGTLPERLSRALDYLLHIIQSDLLFENLSDPNILSTEHALYLARQVVNSDASLANRLANLVQETLASSSVDAVVTDRMLDLLEAISNGSRVLPTLTTLLRHENSKVRSKAILLTGKRLRSLHWIRLFAADSNPAVRANALESLWGSQTEEARALFTKGAQDPDPGVAANALLGLYLAGDSTAIPAMLRLLSHSEPEFRAAGAGLMGKTGHPRFLAVLTERLRDADGNTRSNAFRAISALRAAQASLVLRDPLTLAVVAGGSLPTGVRRIVIGVATPDGAKPGPIPATAFIVTENGKTIWDYSVQPLPALPPDLRADSLPERMRTAQAAFYEVTYPGGACCPEETVCSVKVQIHSEHSVGETADRISREPPSRESQPVPAETVPAG